MVTDHKPVSVPVIDEPLISECAFVGTMRQQLIPAHPVQETLYYRAVKRLADLVIASLAIAVFTPLFLVVSLLIWLEDRGPILYSQPRIGRYGVPFWFYKFRSMRTDADRSRADLLAHSDCEGAAFKMKRDPRVTRIGKTIRKYSIDEMPQLFSVMAGHMSIVGPRPHLAAEVETYAHQEHVRLFVKPGLLCLREVSGRSKISFDDWIKLDIEYVETRNLLLDAKIFLLAIPAVLKADGAY